MRGFWRTIAIFLLGGILGTGFGAGLGFFFFPYVFPPPAAAEQLTDADRSALVAVKDAMFVDLGGLRAFKGSQRYPIPAGVDLKNYPSVVIWCERFGVPRRKGQGFDFRRVSRWAKQKPRVCPGLSSKRR